VSAADIGPFGESTPASVPPSVTASASPTPTPTVTPELTVTPEPTETPEPTPRALRIGVLVPFTGALSDFGEPFANAAGLAVDEINEAGGVLGQDVVLVLGDSGTEPMKAQEEARRLIDVEGVSAILGAADSEVTLPVAESVTVPNEIVQISPASTSAALTAFDDDDFLWRTAIADAAHGAVLAHMADALGFTRACTMYVDAAWSQAISEQFTETFEKRGGTVTAQVPHAVEGQASYRSELGDCSEGDPEVLAAISYPEHVGVYLGEALEYNVVDNFLFCERTKWYHEWYQMFEAIGWESFEGMYGTAPGALWMAVGEAFTAAYEAEYGEEPLLPFIGESYDAVYVIALAAEKAGSTESRAIRDALRDIANPPGEVVNAGVEGYMEALDLLARGTDIDYQGAAGPLDFDENGDVLQGAIDVWQIANRGIVEAIHTFFVDLGTPVPTIIEVTQ
ncbi:MAG: ABC transporter substrate-binding protein, partial [Dehalococcoidia bacterium]